MNDPLRSCPLCLRKVEPNQLGFRDFRWLGNTLPGRVAPMDFDGVLERNGSVVIFEWKPRGVALGTGQRLTFKTFVRMGCEVWLVNGNPEDETVVLSEVSREGRIVNKRSVSVDQLREMVGDWWASHA